MTNQNKWVSPLSTALNAANSAFKAPNFFAGAQNWWSSDGTNGITIVFSIPCNTMELRFYGKQTTGSITDKEAFVRLWRITDLNAGVSSCEAYVTWLGDLKAVFGTKELDSAVMPVTGTGTAWAKEIAVIRDRSLFPGFRQIGQGDSTYESVPDLVLDATGCPGFAVQMVQTAGAGSNPAERFGFSYRFM